MIPLVEGVWISEGAAMGASFTETTSRGDSGTLKILIHYTSEWWREMSSFSHNSNYGNAPDWETSLLLESDSWVIVWIFDYQELFSWSPQALSILTILFLGMVNV